MKKSILVCLTLLTVLAFAVSAIEQSKDQNGRRKAIEKTTAQAALTEIERKNPNASAQLSAVEKEIEADLSVDKAYKHMTFLVEEVGQRLAGTKSIAKAAHYIRKELEGYGLDARIDRFYMYHSYPEYAALKVIYPEDRAIEAKPCCHILSTLEEGLTGELVYAGAGGYEDYESLQVKDKIVLVDMTWAPPRPEKARIALEKGAKALVIMNWGTSDNPVIQMGAIKSVWGNPTPESFKQIPQIPVISITRASGEYLKELCSKGKVKVWLRAEATREWVLANQPIGTLYGTERPEEFVLVGGHLEAWGKTAICNSSGNSQILELARVLAKHKDKLKRSIVFGFWDGHEIAEAAGSTYYVDTNWDKLAQHCIAYVNIDNPGIVGTSIPKSSGVPEVREFQKSVVKDVWGEEGDWSMAYKGGDESFLGVGVPYIGFSTGYTPEELERLNWASLSPWLHSEADTLDKIDKKLYEKHLHFFAVLITRLCNSEMVPYDLSALVGVSKSHVESLKELSEGIKPIELNSLMAKVQQLESAVQSLNKYKEEMQAHQIGSEKEAIDLINEASIRVSRELSPILWMEADKYNQDPYGYYLVGKPIPKLYIPITNMRKLKENQEEFHLWHTQFIRERNRVSNAIGNAIGHLTLTTKLLEELK
ncbi:MAG: M28 family metallopeptidase [Candidatus Aminicenantes bacterium]|nr:M28 family metallopeptidase [Candidatus Aminicenantes bacterium]MDH5714366.1 M28 family metallopeptidase [Candidatus Aminicenantes bacterium]